MLLKATGAVGICDECKQRIPIYDDVMIHDDHFVMPNHGMFEVGVDEGNIICPASFTSRFQTVLDEGKLFGEGPTHDAG